MKFLYVFAIFALAFAAFVSAQDCDPDSNNQPTCNGSNEGQIFRNFWDPTRYWQCTGGVATVVLCKGQTGFDPITNVCVPWSQWEWQPPCPQ